MGELRFGLGELPAELGHLRGLRGGLGLLGLEFLDPGERDLVIACNRLHNAGASSSRLP